MKKIKNRNLFLLMLLAGMLANALLCLSVFIRENGRKRAVTFSKAANLIENLHAKFNVEIALKPSVAHILNLVVESDFATGQRLFREWLRKNLIPDNAANMVFYENNLPLNPPSNDVDGWSTLIKTISRNINRKYRLEGDKRNGLIKLLKGGVGFEMIESKPGVLRRMNRGPEFTYGAWQESSEPEKKNSAILMIHEGRLPESFLAKFLLSRHRLKCGLLAYVDIFKPENSIVPEGYFSPYDILSLVRTFDIKNKKGRFIIGGHEIYLDARPDGRILILIPWENDKPVPVWVLSLPFFWIPLLWRMLTGERASSGFSLRNLIGIVALTGIILPALLTGLYWKSFFETQMASQKIEYARKLEENLIQIDAGHQVILRLNKQKFRDLFNILDRKPENLQLFIDESVRMEINGMLDAVLLVEEDGHFLRPFSSCLSTVRGLVFYPKKYREEVVRQHFARGWVPFDLEVDYLMNTEKVDLNLHVDFKKNQGQVIITSLGKMAGKDIIKAYNTRHGFSAGENTQKISSMVMSSFVESAEENPAEVISQNLGDYVEFGLGEYQSRNFVNVIRDSNGKAIYCAIIYGASLLTAEQYFNRVFAWPRQWPEGVKFMAISGLPLRLCYPWPDAWRRMESLLSQLQPPRNLLVDEVLINSQKFLRCAYVARKCSDYILVAYVPLSQVQAEMNDLAKRLLLGGLLLTLILVYVFWRLSLSVLEPARQLMKGVAALEQKEHSYQICLQTEDEWQQLGSTFNTALEKIKELEVAHFVQTCILPSGEIRAANSVFSGKTVPAADVGGDLYEAFDTHQGMTFVMGDVSGHSISAALVVNMADAAFSALVDQGLHLPHDIFDAMNNLMLEHLGRIKMMTAFAGFVDRNGMLTYSNAGQAYPFLISDEGVKTLSLVGYPLGAAKRKKFKFETMQLPAKCRLLMFSDGIIEALDSNGNPFGYERLELLVADLGCHICQEEFIGKIFAELRSFTGPIPWGDDATLVLLDHDRTAIVNRS